jgi:hypothetical protein
MPNKKRIYYYSITHNHNGVSDVTNVQSYKALSECNEDDVKAVVDDLGIDYEPNLNETIQINDFVDSGHPILFGTKDVKDKAENQNKSLTQHVSFTVGLQYEREDEQPIDMNAEPTEIESLLRSAIEHQRQESTLAPNNHGVNWVTVQIDRIDPPD